MPVENVERVVDAITSNLFASAGMDKSIFQRKDYKASILPDFTNYIRPFVATEETRKIKTNLPSVVCSGFDPNIQITTFPKEYLESVLQLEPPKKVIQYSASSSDIKAKAAPKPKPRVSKARVILPTGSPEAHEEEEEPMRQTVSIATKRTRPNTSGLPSNFYPLVQPLFDEFWHKEFTDQTVTCAFFAVITNSNCAQYSLSSFSEQSYSLPIINDKIKHRKYVTAEEFNFDFQQLFCNIIRYYQEEHPAVAVARDFQRTFELKWRALEPRFSWPGI